MELRENIQGKELNLIEILSYYYKNFLRLIVYTLIPFSIGLGVIFYIHPIMEQRENLFYSNIMIQNPEITQNINEGYLFSSQNLSEALKRSNLSKNIQVDAKFLSSFRIVSGHSELNLLIDDYIESDLETVTQNLYFKPEEIDTFIKDLISKGNKFKVIIFDRGDINISNTEVNLLLSNLIEVINNEISILNDSSNITLKAIPPLSIGNPLSSIDVNRLNNRLTLVRDYINKLENSYLSFAPEINLKVLSTDLASSEDLFNYIIQENNIHLNIVLRRINLDIDSIDKRITVVKDKFDYLTKNQKFNEGNFNDTKSTSVQADSTFINTILSLGEQASNLSQISTYIDEIANLENTRITLEKRLSNLQMKNDFDITFDEANNYLVDSLNSASRTINEYINTVKTVKKQTESIVILSTIKQSSQDYYAAIMKLIIMILIGSFIFAFGILTIRIFKDNFIK